MYAHLITTYRKVIKMSAIERPQLYSCGIPLTKRKKKLYECMVNPSCISAFLKL